MGWDSAVWGGMWNLIHIASLLQSDQILMQYQLAFQRSHTCSWVDWGSNTLSNSKVLFLPCRVQQCTMLSPANSTVMGPESSLLHRQNTLMFPLSSCNYKSITISLLDATIHDYGILLVHRPKNIAMIRRFRTPVAFLLYKTQKGYIHCWLAGWPDYKTISSAEFLFYTMFSVQQLPFDFSLTLLAIVAMLLPAVKEEHVTPSQPSMTTTLHVHCMHAVCCEYDWPLSTIYLSLKSSGILKLITYVRP